MAALLAPLLQTNEYGDAAPEAEAVIAPLFNPQVVAVGVIDNVGTTVVVREMLCVDVQPSAVDTVIEYVPAGNAAIELVLLPLDHANE